MIEVAHWSALVPLAVFVVKRDVHPVYWMIALAFAVDWFVDAFAAATGGSWALDPWYPVVQFALLAWAVGGIRWGLVTLLLTAMLAPLVWAKVAGAAVVLWLARGHRMALPIYLYAGAGTVLYLWMIQDLAYAVFMPKWYAYQAVRLMAFATFVVMSLPRAERIGDEA